MHLQRFLAILEEKILVSLGNLSRKVMIVTMMSSASPLVIILRFFLLYPSAKILVPTGFLFVENLQEQILSLSSSAKIMA